MARVLQYVCGGLGIGILSVLVNIHPAAAAEDCKTAGVCKNEGLCETGWTPCHCRIGFTGDTCETPPCTTHGNECGDNGRCTGTGANVKCEAFCTSDPDCGDNGKCTGTDYYKKCECENGYSGDHCKTAPNCNCTCDTSGTTFQCTCMDSYTGNQCAKLLKLLRLRFVCP